MPVIKSAKKKLKQDKKRQTRNSALKQLFTKTLKNVRKAPSVSGISEAFRVVDKATKHNLIHKNKGARIKSKLSKLVTTKEKSVEKPIKTTRKTKKTS